MISAVPELDIFYIDLNTSLVKKAETNKIVEMSVNVLRCFGHPLPTIDLSFQLGKAAINLARLIRDNRFHVIESKDELEKFENAYGNSWVTNQKALKKKQYYIRHPRTSRSNLLIEARYFYKYIEEEQKDELINFILSNHSVKVLKIDRHESHSTNGKASSTIPQASVDAHIESSKVIGNYYSMVNPNGSKRLPPRNTYCWLDQSLMYGILALSEGSTLTQTYECDFTFGLHGREAKTLGLDLNHHTKYSYTVHIEC